MPIPRQRGPRPALPLLGLSLLLACLVSCGKLAQDPGSMDNGAAAANTAASSANASSATTAPVPAADAGSAGNATSPPVDDGTRSQTQQNPDNLARQSPTQKGEEHSDHDDPFLKYATDVKVRVSQIDVAKYPTVRAYVSVVDSLGIPIRTLKDGDFTVKENGSEATDVHFANAADLDLPLSIMFAVDVSGSMEPAIQQEIDAISAFVEQLQPRDRVGLITFSDAAVREVPLTTDHAAFLQRVGQLAPYGQTALWDGIQLGVEELLADDQPSRKALIVMSDGADNRSLESPATLSKFYEDNLQAKNKGFSVFALGLGAEVDRSAMGSFATRTGGLYMDSPTQADLANVYQTILHQIQNEYRLEYTSPLKSEVGAIINLEVGLKPVKGFDPGLYSYRSPGLAKLLARSLIPGIIAIAIMMLILIILTIFKLARKVWLTVMITQLEGKDYAVSALGGDIGSLEGCEVRIGRDPAMLPLHASLKETHEGYLLEAVDPTAPILMESRMLARKLLRDGDRFMLGSTVFVFHERLSRPGAGPEMPVDDEVFSPIDPALLSEQAQRASGGAVAAAGGGPEASLPPLGNTAAGPRVAPKALQARSGPLAGQRFELHSGDNSIGRTDGSITLSADTQVSRRHAVIKLEPTGATLLDNGSTNGTRLNGVPCQAGLPQPVYAGDVIGIGNGEYILE